MNAAPPLTLFIIKKHYHYDRGQLISSGLRNSAAFVVDMLLSEGRRARLEVAIDGNCIDRMVTEHRPAKVVIEALWVTPAKLAELQKLHQGVAWCVRIHSETPFLANEGVAVEWIRQYLEQGVEVAFNSPDTADDFLGATGSKLILWLPNYYPQRKPRPWKPNDLSIDVGCFGAVRPLKNQLIQAVAAQQYARMARAPLRFHMNGARVEQFGDSNLRNIRALLGDDLVMHEWHDHSDFCELIASMDICLQVSLSESFCIVASDAVSMGVPLVGSAAIKWLPERSQARVDNADSIVDAMTCADHAMIHMNSDALKRYLREAVMLWLRWTR